MNFIIDNNVLRAALSGNNPNTGEFDATSLTLLLLIPTKCHSFIVTKEIEHDFIRIFDELGNRSHGKTGLDAIKAYFNAKKMRKVDDTRSSNELPHGPREENIKDEDLPLQDYQGLHVQLL